MSELTRKASLLGRLSSGMELDRGSVVHLVVGHKAICGRTYGKRSAGWRDEEGDVTCPKCLKKSLKP